ncbi:MAG: 4-alpha-glucanotransferase [Acidaminococcales bacterium]|nr:4-alpha-glucanotransferase [Acidaminococcales bacterium]
MISLLHDSQNLLYRDPFGARPIKGALRLALETVGQEPSEVLLRLWRDGEYIYPMARKKAPAEKSVWRVEITLPDKPCLAWYYFIVKLPGRTLYYGNNPEQLGGRGKIYDSDPVSYQITVYDAQKMPGWLYGGMIYQIFPDRFFNPFPAPLAKKPDSLIHDDWHRRPLYARDRATGEIMAYDFFGGNLDGITAKLDYLEDFGVTLIYLNPIFLSVSNHRFDTGDYEKVDPVLGDLDAFKRLCHEAKERGIRVILDGVFSHTGSDSRYFNKEGTFKSVGAWQSKDSPFYSWYRFKNYPHEYESWWGIGNLPNVDELNPDYLYYIVEAKRSVACRWLQAGASGWRLDVADELPTEFIKLLRWRIKLEDPECFLLGEVWEDASRKVAYNELRCYFLGNQLDSVMNYPFRDCVLDFLLARRSSREVMARLYSLYENYPAENFGLLMNLLGTHDTARIFTELSGVPGDNFTDTQKRGFYLSGRERCDALRLLWLAVVWQMTFCGLPSVYYGDEAGAEGFSDPFNRATYPWGKEDPDVYKYYWRLSRLRRRYPALRRGAWLPLQTEPDILSYKRLLAAEEATVVLNRGRQRKTFSMDGDSALVDVLSGEVFSPRAGRVSMPVDGGMGRVLRGGVIYPDRTRKAGLLLHPSSLPSDFGIGDFGPGAYEFIDFAVSSGHQIWQLLPLNTIDYAGSPYAGDSAFAGNTLLISPELLLAEGYIAKEDIAAAKAGASETDRVDFSQVKERKEKIFRRAYKQFAPGAEFERFHRENAFWADDYALYKALQGNFGGAHWNGWPQKLFRRDPDELAAFGERLAGEIGYQLFLQYEFWRQWALLKEKANQKGLIVIGDIPIYLSGESADVWSNRQFFELEEDGAPAAVAGVPPDYFSETGQLWGNPLYNWAALKGDGYGWWKKRLEHGLKACNLLRLDHFRALDSYWRVPRGSATAAPGQWRAGPGEDFLLSLQKHFGGLPFIVEDLGDITPSVHRLRDRFALPGTDVLQFGVSSDITKILYTGTHDNDTLLGWAENNRSDPAFVRMAELAGIPAMLPKEETADQFLKFVYTSDHIWVIAPLQDLLALPGSARMNTPGVALGNWGWRLPPGRLDERAAQRGRELVTLGERVRVKGIDENIPGMCYDSAW